MRSVPEHAGVRLQRRGVPRAGSRARMALQARKLEDFVYAVGEALANSVEYGHREGSYFSVRCWRDGGEVVAEIEDDGPGFNPYHVSAEPRHPDTRGFGLTLMRALSDRVAFARNGRTVRLRKRIVPADSATQDRSA